jgi:hypothetical protein
MAKEETWRDRVANIKKEEEKKAEAKEKEDKTKGWDKRKEKLKEKFEILKNKPRPLKELLLALAHALKWVTIASAVVVVLWKIIIPLF